MSEEFEDWEEYSPCEGDEALEHPEECGVELEDEPMDFDEELYEEFEEEEF